MESRTFEDLYNTYGPMVVRRCSSIIKDQEEAMDVAQEVFLKIFRKGNYKTLEFPSSYLYTVATNLSLNHLRSQRNRPAQAEDVMLMILEAPDAPEEKVMNKYLIDDLFSQVKTSTKTIAYLHYVDGFTLEETAEMVGMSVSGIRKRLRGLRSIGLEIKGEE